jgi:hypothetical protein
MRGVFTALMTLHALIHLVAFAAAFGLVKVPWPYQPSPVSWGLIWLVAAALILASLFALNVWPPWWWAIAVLAVIVSQATVVASWSDAKLATLGNIMLVMGAAHGFFNQGPTSFQASFDEEVAVRVAAPSSVAVVTDAELAKLPEPVRRYLRATGVVGKPRVRSYRVLFSGRIRSSPEAPWMPFEAEQHSFVRPPVRLFLMRATKGGLPVQVLHRLVAGSATMRVRLLGVWPLVDASGPVMDRSETVTLLNDMCILAPASLLDASVTWQAIDADSARATFSNGRNTISALLTFDAVGLLTNFTSEDRSRASADGRSFSRAGFSTPLRDYRNYRGQRLASYGEAHFHPPSGEFAYGEFHVLDVQLNP